ncbi:GH36-type glycosyl hydrolase domain-containing protein [Bdellovibrio sp. BCCA]|uniref:GH36-type glycosyl hydrolase domain-containing protein n=1 Tax=Bdellovibrio sp. BCCA TaxID=3136281 RepID=UPI0030F34036
MRPSLTDIAETPIRGEIYSLERLEEYAVYLAEHLEVDKAPKIRRRLLHRMRDSGDKLLSSYKLLVEAARNKEAVSPAAEWLIDNFYVVEEQLREIQEDLPKSYYEELPKISIGDLAGYPRIYALSLALVAHSDSRLDVETIRRFIQAFQTKAYLNIGELWAVAITLRLALVENIRRVALRIVWDRNQQKQADLIVDEIVEKVRDPAKLKKAIESISQHCGRNIEAEYAFISQMAKKLRDQESDIWPASEYLENILQNCHCTLEEVVYLEHQHQAANQVTIANIISSMRLLSNIDWKVFFESVSLLDQDLATDPSGDYLHMEFATRDEYRHTIERIGKRTGAAERDIARQALVFAEEAKTHVGFYLKDYGLLTLEKKFHYSPPLKERVVRALQKWPTLFYLSSLTVLIAALLVLPIWYASLHGALWGGLVGIAWLFFIPASDFAVSLFNFALTHILGPRHLAKMDVSQGVPAEARTMIIVPCLLPDLETVRHLLEKLEVHYLGNRDPEIYFALVTDYIDAPQETMPEDVFLLNEAQSGIARLNQIYANEGEDRFFLFHRKRKWNDVEKKWMGWERKRGKIHELNRLLRGDHRTSYIVATAPVELRSSFKYIITLDADTQLGLDTAKKLIGTALHPLNRALVDKTLGRVTKGYGIIQPRISISLESSSRSTFAAIFSGHTGIDPYTTAVSDVYQDLFKEGSFTGKGLYEIDIFESVLKDRVPENTVLSHDLFEGLFARVALATDIELLDDYPGNYFNYIQRQHRWVRGDWQIWRWILPFVPNSSGRKVLNQLPLISRWKIYDNLRRSLVAIWLFVAYVLGWLILPGHALFWTLLTTLVIALPCFLHVANGLFVSPRGMPWTSSFWSELGRTKTSLAQFTLSLIFLPHKAFAECDAIARALYRSHVSKRKCLEWVASAQVDKGYSLDRSIWKKSWPVEVILGLLFAVLLVRGNGTAFVVALPFLLVWASQPLVAQWTSLRLRKKSPELSENEKVFLNGIARKIWHFFETFVGPQDNWLPPDNVQEDPEHIVAHRTSPTNMGLYALCLISAKDLGYISPRSCVKIINAFFATAKKLEKFHGHFLNWYDTQSLEPLYPKYVSVVDSGNFAGALLVTKQACLELTKSPFFPKELLSGAQVTLSLIEEEVLHLRHQRQATNAISSTHLYERILEAKRILLGKSPENLEEWFITLRFLTQSMGDIDDSLTALELEHGLKHYENLRGWVKSLMSLLTDLDQDLQLYFPFLQEESQWRQVPEWSDLRKSLLENRGAEDLLNAYEKTKEQLIFLKSRNKEYVEFCERLLEKCEGAIGNLKNFLSSVARIEADCEDFFEAMDFSFLMDKEREVFSIGYNVTEMRSDNAYYDLLASEARLASFIAIIKGDVGQKHWFRLGRQLVPVDGQRALVSWSASMFEYLMPQLVMKNYESTLLYETVFTVVRRQISYGKKLRVPWGISEAGYNARDLNFNYQYGPFGVPGLGLKRGLGHDLVVSPYSTFLAAMVSPVEAIKNLRHFIQQNILTRYGFYEAIDYTPERLSPEQKFSVIRSYMAHHQGMSLVAVDNILNSEIMQERFHAESRVRAAQVLLQERIPQKVLLAPPKAAAIEWNGVEDSLLKSFSRVYDESAHHSPRVQILSNGKYSLMLSTAGAGYSKCEDLAVSRWREDATRDHWGSFFFIRDLENNMAWSASSQPSLKKPDNYKVIFSEDKVEFLRQDGDLRTHSEVIVAPESNLDMRSISVSNDSFKERFVEVTSYMEPVLAPLAEDQAHPAFSNLFVQTEFLSSKNCLLARRRPRSVKKNEVWGFHGVTTDQALESGVEYETDRARFIGRGRSLQNPSAMSPGAELTNTVGSTLDPVLSLRVKVRIPPGETRRIQFTTGIAFSKDEVLQLADRYHDILAFERESQLAWTKSRMDLRHLGMDSEAAYLFQRLAERILYSDPSLRQPSHFLAAHTREQASLWPYGISGDLPIVVLRVADKRDLGMLRRLLRGHEYLRLKGLSYDFVILNDPKSVYLQDLQEEILRQVRYSGYQGWLNKPGGIFSLRLDTMPEKDRALIQAMARVVLSSELGSLKEQVARKILPEKYAPIFVPADENRKYPKAEVLLPELKFFNGLGGFSADGREYIIYLKEGLWTPAPWINVIANPHDFGFQISETGAGFTWSVNSRENRLTPWSNDPVCDPPGEILYLRDEETGKIWSPTPLPIRDSGLYIIRHGQGYTKFEHSQQDISSYLNVFVPKDDSVKITHLRLKNISTRKRKISVWAYVEWVLGNQRDKSAPYIFTEVGADKTIFAKNSYNHEFAERISFFKMLGTAKSFTCDRKEFLGRNGHFSSPEALQRQNLSGRTGIGLDPCGALQTMVEIKPHEEVEITFLLGQAENKTKAQELILKYQKMEAVENAYHEMCAMWDEILNVIQVKTPDQSLDFLLNRWLLYQSIVCRFWARSAFYQSGGAYGFRDQLQDCMAFVYARPALAREHILRAASRQFPEGDVQHWWHPPTGRGVRTHFSDDLLWLPLVVSHYIRCSGDEGILQEKVSFIEAPLLSPEQEDAYTQPEKSALESPLLDHCLRTIDHSLKLGKHGLPLIGSGDWNDGMNRVGEKGQGESVWMAWFLIKVIEDFLPFCEPEKKAQYVNVVEVLKKNVEANSWDGQWYRRAYFDDGTPIGSRESEECKIDSLAQTWSILSGAGSPERQRQAMQSVWEHLVLKDKNIILLLTPPFDKTPLDPGYIKGYVPGVRENGGQYTHAALWVLMAFAKLKDTTRVYEIFSMLNPIQHSRSRAGVQKYKIEPYVVAADVYAVEPHTGRGGWSWYTGSASWFYRAGIESLLGIHIEGNRMYFKPCVPETWPFYDVQYRYKRSLYKIRVENFPQNKNENLVVVEEGRMVSDNGELRLVDDAKTHEIVVQVPYSGFVGKEKSFFL